MDAAVEYVVGEHPALVMPGLIVLTVPEYADRLLGLWDTPAPEPALGRVLGALSGGSIDLVSLPGFAIMVLVDGAAHILVRGPYRAVVGPVGAERTLQAQGLVSWAEERSPGDTLVRLEPVNSGSPHGAGPDPAQSPACSELPVREGVIRVGRLSARLAVSTGPVPAPSGAACSDDPDPVVDPAQTLNPPDQPDLPDPSSLGKPSGGTDRSVVEAGPDGSGTVPSLAGRPVRTPLRRESPPVPGWLRGNRSTPVPAGQRPSPSDPGRQLLATECPAGHLTPAEQARCRVCQAPVDARDVFGVSRPTLGRLRIEPDGREFRIRTGLIIGRAPEVEAARGSRTPELVTVPSPDRDVSRSHCELQVRGWQVSLLDLDTGNGTELTLPSGERRRLTPAEPVLIEPSTVITLSPLVSLTYLVP